MKRLVTALLITVSASAAAPDSLRLAIDHNNRAQSLQRQHRFEEADAEYQAALSHIARAKDADAPEAGALFLRNLASLRHAQGRYVEAERLYRRGIDILARLRGEGDARTRAARRSLGLMFVEIGRYGQAERILEVLLSAEENSPTSDPRALATALSDLGLAYTFRKSPDSALPLLERSRQLQESAANPDRPKLALTLNSLAWLHFRRRDFGRATTLLEQARDLQDANGAPKSDRMLVKFNLAQTLAARKRWHDAEPLSSEVMAYWTRTSASPNPSLRNAASFHAEVLRRTGRKKEAASQRASALAMEQALAPENHGALAVDLRDLMASR